jgi:hypothetical protein
MMLITGKDSSTALSPPAVPPGAADPELEQLQYRSANEDNQRHLQLHGFLETFYY